MAQTDDPGEKSQTQIRDADYEEDPFISDHESYTGPTPPDLVENHDKYLYGEDD